MNKHKLNNILDFSKPSKRLADYLDSKLTYIHCNSDREIDPDILLDLIDQVESKEIKTYLIQDLPLEERQ